jgi:hypothetical protein
MRLSLAFRHIEFRFVACDFGNNGYLIVSRIIRLTNDSDYCDDIWEEWTSRFNYYCDWIDEI